MSQNLSANKNAEYCRPGKVEAIFGIGRPLLYAWEKRGLIKMIKIKAPGCERGITLVHVPTLRALIEKFAA